MSRDEDGKFLPGHTIRRTYPPEADKRSVTLSVRVTGDLAERAYAAAGRRQTTLSKLLRGYLRTLAAELPRR